MTTYDIEMSFNSVTILTYHFLLVGNCLVAD